MEISSVFLDSNYLIALFYPGDTQNEKAREYAARLDKENKNLVISSFIFLEAVTVTSQRGGKEAGLSAGEHLLGGKIKIVHINEETESETWRLFKEIKNKDISFVDASIIATMRAEGIQTLLTFDVTHFKSLAKEYRLKLFKS